MTLNLALVISGDSAGAKSAVSDTTRAVQGLGQATRDASQPLGSMAAGLNAGAAAAGREKLAYDQLNTSLAANVNARRQFQQFQTANIAAQFQDIAVTAAAGQSVGQIALQQGAQLTMALGNQGLKGTLLALGGAVTSLLNPMSLLTIGAVALGAAGIQAFMGMVQGADQTSDALARNKAWLSDILTGYEAAKTGADHAAEAARKLPQGVVTSDLNAGIGSGQDAVDAVNARLAAQRAALQANIAQLQAFKQSEAAIGTDTSGVDTFIGQLTQLSDLSTAAGVSLDGAMTAVRELQNTATDPALKHLAGDVYDLQLQLRNAQGDINTTTAALAALNNEALQGAVGKATGTATDAIDALKKLAPDLRTDREKARDALNAALGSSPDALLRTAAQQQYDQTIAALDAQDQMRKLRSGAKSSGGSATTTPAEAKDALDFYTRIHVEQDAINAAHQRQIDLLKIATSGAEELASALGDGKLDLREIVSLVADVAKQIFALPGRSQGSTLLSDLFSGLLGIGGGGGGSWNIPTSFVPGGFYPGLAGGGTVTSAGLTLVGEEGPELLRLPAGAQVIPNRQSMAMLGNGGDTHNWFVQTPSPRQFVQSRATLARTASRLAASAARVS